MSDINHRPEIDLPEIVGNAVFRAMTDIFPIIEATSPESQDPARGLEMCSALLTSIITIAEARYGAEGVDTLMECLVDFAAPAIKAQGQRLRRGMN